MSSWKERVLQEDRWRLAEIRKAKIEAGKNRHKHKEIEKTIDKKILSSRQPTLVTDQQQQPQIDGVDVTATNNSTAGTTPAVTAMEPTPPVKND